LVLLVSLIILFGHGVGGVDGKGLKRHLRSRDLIDALDRCLLLEFLKSLDPQPLFSLFYLKLAALYAHLLDVTYSQVKSI